MTKDKTALNIVVIEDNPGDYLLVEDYLEEQFAAATVHHAKNFREAKILIPDSGKHFDVVLLDLSLPDKSGETLLTEISSLCPTCPVIVLTGYTDIDFSIKSLSMGIADYLIKEEITAASLYKSIIYNIERKKTSIALQESEKRYSNLFQLSPQPMWVYDLDTYRFVQVNQAAREHYGYSEAEFLQLTILDIRPEEDVAAAMAFYKKKTGEKKEPTMKGTVRHYKKSGELINVETFSTPIMINDKYYMSVIAVDITEKILYERAILKAIIKTQEDERYEIGSELHDNVCQLLATTKLTLGMLKPALPEASMNWFEQCNKYIMLASDEIRNLSHRLAPAFFDETTLQDTFRLLLDTFNIGDKYNVYLYFDDAVKQNALHRDVQLNLYRILQEQLRNILKYAGATAIEVEVVIKRKNLVMRIYDDGAGFDIKTAKKGIGLANMKRRAELFSGKIDINSSPGKGCEVMVSLPLQEINVVK